MYIKHWFFALRPKTLPAGLSPVILGIALIYFHFGRVDWIVAFIVLTTALLLQISTNLTNDYYDCLRGLDNHRRLGPIRFTGSGLISKRSIQIGFLTTYSISTLLGVYLITIGGWPIAMIGLTSITLAYAYTGGPYPLSYLPLGEMLALIFFGPVAVGGTYYLQYKSLIHNLNFYPNYYPLSLPISSYQEYISDKYMWKVLWFGLGPGLISSSIMSINNLRDRENDHLHNKFTLAVFLGEKKARYLCIAFTLTSSLVPLVAVLSSMVKNNIWGIISILTPLLFWRNWQHLLYHKIDSSMNKVLATTGKYLLVYTFTLVLSLV